MKPKLNIRDWFFAAKTPRLPAKSRLAKVLTVFKADGYQPSKNGTGALEHVEPRKFRRGRIRWVDGRMDTSAVHFKLHSKAK